MKRDQTVLSSLLPSVLILCAGSSLRQMIETFDPNAITSQKPDWQKLRDGRPPSTGIR